MSAASTPSCRHRHGPRTSTTRYNAGHAQFTPLQETRFQTAVDLPLFYLGTPRNSLRVSEVVDHAVSEARVYQECGVDGVIVENMHDTPYLRGGGGPEVTACMTRVCAEVRQALGGNIPLGVQILSGSN